MKILLVVAVLLLSSPSFAATRYVGKTNAADSGTCTNQSTPCATIAYGVSQMAGGDTLIVGDGTYTGTSNIILDPPSGTAGAYTTIRAETDFGVLLDGSSWGTNNWVYGIRIENRSYVTVQGFRINAAQNATGGPIYMGNGANHIKIIRNGFFGGVVTDNGETAGTGPDTSYILFEENYSFGGGRAGFTAYWSDHVVFRRNVVRIDYYRFDLQSSGFCNYDSSNTVFQNNIVVDMAGGSNVSPSLQVYAPFFFENKSDHEPNTSIEMHGNIVLNNSTYYGAVWDQVPASTRVLRDNIFWGNSGGFQTGEYENGETFIAPTYDIQRLTSGNNNKSYDHWNNAFDHAAVYTAPADGLNGAGTGISIAENRTVSFQNSLLYGNPSYGAADYAQGNYNAYYGNGAARGGSHTPSAGANDITSHDAIYSGSNTSGSIKWLPKGPESGSVLATAGSSSGKIGAEVMWKIGVDGTLYGESGWNTVRSPANGYGGTSDRLWPFPNETQIKSDMSAYSGGGLPGARGFATGTSMDGTVQSLTKYIWEAAGNQAPADYYDVGAVNGACGVNSGGTFTALTPNTAGNCSAGTVASFTGAGPWTWGCDGSGGGTSTSSTACSASLASDTAPGRRYRYLSISGD